MKKILLIIFGLIAILNTNLRAQSFSPQMDTAYGYNYTGGSVFNKITNNTTDSITLKWKVVGTNFPADWLSGLGICDNNLCYSNGTGGYLWTSATSMPNHTITSRKYGPGVAGDFHYLSTPGTTLGTYYVTVNLSDEANGYNKNVTFIITKGTTAVTTVTKSEDDVVIYPNPARNDINVIFNADAGVKNIAVYNLIGKPVTFYRITGNSANLNIENIPAGIYFIRLLDADGGVVATRKFTKQ